MLQGSILLYFWPSFSYHLSLRPLLYPFLSGHLRQVLLYSKHKILFNNAITFIDPLDWLTLLFYCCLSGVLIAKAGCWMFLWQCCPYWSQSRENKATSQCSLGSPDKSAVGTQKNCLLLSTRNTCLKWWIENNHNLRLKKLYIWTCDNYCFSWSLENNTERILQNC